MISMTIDINSNDIDKYQMDSTGVHPNPHQLHPPETRWRPKHQSMRPSTPCPSPSRGRSPSSGCVRPGRRWLAAHRHRRRGRRFPKPTNTPPRPQYHRDEAKSPGFRGAFVLRGGPKERVFFYPYQVQSDPVKPGPENI